MNYLKMEKYVNDKWEPCEMKSVKKGDKLKVQYSQRSELLTAITDPYVNKERLTWELVTFQEKEQERWVLEGPVHDNVLKKLKIIQTQKKQGKK